MSLFSDLSALVTIVEKDIPVALELKDAVVKVITDLSPGLFGAAPGEDLAGCCDRLKVGCEKHLNKMDAAAPVGKIFPGDGSFLRAFMQIILQLLPLILTPAPTP